jgi:MFS transporter, FHS family, glucose/mannose:H+ symporter
MTAGTRLLLLVTGLASFILLGLAQSIFGPILPVYAQGFGLDIAAVGWLLSVFWGGCLGGVIAVYVWPALMGPKTGLALAALGTALMGWMSSWGVVLGGGLAFGAGYGVIAAVYNPRVLAAFGPRGAAMMGLLNAIFTLGAIASPKVFLALGSNPGLTFAVFTGFALAIFALALTMGDTRVKAEADEGPVTLNWPILGFAMMGIGLESCLVGLGPTALVLAGETKEQAAELLSRFFITYLLARTLLIFLAARMPPFPLYLFATATTAGLAVLAVMGDAGFWFPFMGFACGFFFQGAFLTGLSRMGTTTRVSAIMLTAGLVGAILMPMIIAQVLEGLGPKGFFQIVLGLAVTLTAAALLMTPRMMRH